MPTPVERFNAALEANAGEFAVQLDGKIRAGLTNYYALLLKWNERLHLVAPCPPEEFATRHVLESLWLLPHLRRNARVVDVGSGGGLPVIPCLIARDALRATLIESSQKKAVFLREALRALDVSERAQVIAARFEDQRAPAADYVTSRALDRFAAMLPQLIKWSPPNSMLLFFGGEEVRRQVEALLSGVKVERVPQSERRLLLIARAT